MVTLKNEYLTVTVQLHGAELSSLRCGDREYLWQADPEFWARHSPVLFPIVGNVYDKQFRMNGQVYPMGQHGFARDCDFDLMYADDTEAWFRLESNEETRAKFPADFVLEIGYRLHGKNVDVMWRVLNPSQNETLHFQIGAHPAFYWPVYDPEQDARGFFAFDAQGILESRKLVGKGCVAHDETFDVALDGQGMFALNADTFDELDTFIFEDGQVHRVTICDVDRRPYLALSFEHPVVGLWSPPGRRAPFVCIEPWFGRCDWYGFEGEFSAKDQCNHLVPGDKFECKYTIEVC